MRIISGTKKRMTLYGPETKDIRPTTDRAKESLFNLINLKVRDSVFIDLFAGTGAISLEAKSRGAKVVYTVDSSSKSIQLINKNIDKSKLDINVIRSEANAFISGCKLKADIIFLDPPFDIKDDEILSMINNIIDKEILKKDGMLIIERESKKENEQIFSKYDKMKVKKYGKVSFIMIG